MDLIVIRRDSKGLFFTSQCLASFDPHMTLSLSLAGRLIAVTNPAQSIDPFPSPLLERARRQRVSAFLLVLDL